jgi:hypothetical protein
MVKKGMRNTNVAHLSPKMKEFVENCLRLGNSIVKVKWKHDQFVKEMHD